MKKLLSVGLLLASSFAASQAVATEMQCYVDTQAYDNYTSNACFAINPATSTTASFRVTATNGTINSVIWGGDASSCGTAGTSCSITVRAYRQYNATATILYSNGTWETVSANASYERGF
jgi:hypothetical protein